MFPLRVLLNASIVISLVAFSACATAPASVPRPDLPPPRADTPAVPLPVPVPTVFSFRDSEYVYEVQETTHLTIRSDSTAPAFDTVQTLAKLTYRIQQAGNAPSILAAVDSLSMYSLRDTSLSTRRLDTVVVVIFPLDPAVAVLYPTLDFPSCDSMHDVARALAQNTVVRIPQSIVAGHTWIDSVTTSLCRGGIPMVSIARSTYQIRDTRDSAGTSLLRVTRTTDLSLSGSGLQASRQVTVVGHGQSETLLTYDIAQGALLGSDGRSSLELTFETLRQRQHVQQESVAKVRRRPQ